MKKKKVRCGKSTFKLFTLDIFLWKYGIKYFVVNICFANVQKLVRPENLWKTLRRNSYKTLLLNAIEVQELNLSGYWFSYTTFGHFFPLYEIAFTGIILRGNVDHEIDKCENGCMYTSNAVRKTTLIYRYDLKKKKKSRINYVKKKSANPIFKIKFSRLKS